MPSHNLNNTSPSNLDKAIRNGDWDIARELLRSNNGRLLVEHSVEESNPLHVACIKKAPFDIIQSMLNISSSFLQERDFVGMTPLHRAIEYRSDEAVIVAFIEAYPQAASMISRYGQTPLHYAIFNNSSTTIIRYLLAAHPSAAIATNNVGNTPIQYFFRMWNVELRNKLDFITDYGSSTRDMILRGDFGKKAKIGKIYKTANFFLGAAAYGTIKDDLEIHFRALHAAIIIPNCPWSFVKFFLKIEPNYAYQQDEKGNLAIHLAAAAKSSFDGHLYRCGKCRCKFQKWYQHESGYKCCQRCFTSSDMNAEQRKNYITIESVDKKSAVVRDLLAIDPNFAEVPNHEGKLPFHIAIKNGKTFNESLDIIFRAAPEALSLRDMKSHLYPFMLAAVDHNIEIDMIQKLTYCFAFLIENPVLVSSGFDHVG